MSLTKTSTIFLTAYSTYRRPRTGGETVRGLTASECNGKKSSGFIQSTGPYVDGQKRNCDERRVLDEPAAARHLAERSIHHWQPHNQCRNAGRRGAGLIRRTGICRTRPDSAQLYELHGLRHTASVQPIKSTAEMMQDQTDSRGGFSRTRHWTLERRFKSGARSDDKGPDDKRRAHAVSDRADSGVSHCGRSPRSSTTRLPCLGSGQYRFTNAGSARARPLGVSEVESGGEATVGPSCGIHLSVQKHFILAATRAAESCSPGVGRRPFGWL